MPGIPRLALSVEGLLEKLEALDLPSDDAMDLAAQLSRLPDRWPFHRLMEEAQLSKIDCLEGMAICSQRLDALPAQWAAAAPLRNRRRQVHGVQLELRLMVREA